MHRLILHNDEIHDAGERVLSPGQVGLMSGWGVFSTIRVCEGVPFAYERHWKRMHRDARALHVPFPEDPEYIRTRIARLIEANNAASATLRVIVVRNRGGIWEGPCDREFDLVAFTTELKDWGRGVNLALRPQGRHAGSDFRGAKILSWALNLTMYEEAHEAGYDEVVLLNERGEVSECTSANLFAAHGNEIWTPPLESGCLPGVTREILLEVAPTAAPVRERTIFPADLEQADEVFITSTTRDLLPVLSLDKRPLGRNSAARKALQEAFSRYADQYVAKRRQNPLPTGADKSN